MKKGDKVRATGAGLGQAGLGGYLANHPDVDADKAIYGTVVREEYKGYIDVDFPLCPLEIGGVWLMESDEIEPLPTEASDAETA